MKTVLFLLVGAVLIGGLALFGLFGGTLGTQNQNSAEDQVSVDELDVAEESTPVTFVGTGTLEGLQQLGTNVECQIDYDAPELSSPVTGTYFVSGENVRGDFILEIPELGGVSVSSVIFTEDMFYSWSEIDGQTYGVKMNLDAMKEMGGEDAREPIPSDVDVAYDCVEWKNVDYSIFDAPTDVLFQDVSKLLQGGMEYGTIYEEGEF